MDISEGIIAQDYFILWEIYIYRWILILSVICWCQKFKFSISCWSSQNDKDDIILKDFHRNMTVNIIWTCLRSLRSLFALTQFTWRSHLVLDIRMMDALPVFGLAPGGSWGEVLQAEAGCETLSRARVGRRCLLAGAREKVRGCRLRPQGDSEDSLR